MLHRKNKNLRLVKESEGSVDKFSDKMMTELNNGDRAVEELEEQVWKRQIHFRKRTVMIIVAVAFAAAALFLFVNLQTYTNVRVADTYKIRGAAESNYEGFAGGVLKYSRDGVSYLNQKGEEQWNQPCQIKNPFVDINEVSAVVADKGGNDIMIFQREGLKGEVKTTLPIEKVSVSEQGIVSVIVKNEASPSIICYDAAGNVLVELQTSLSGEGYPVDISISEDGEVLQVVYFCMKDTVLTSKVSYYNFGKKGEEKTDREVGGKEYKKSVVGTGFFLNQSVSAVVGDNCLTLFKGKAVPEEVTTITIDKEIQSVFHNEKYIGMILKNEGKEGYELCLYNASGKKVMSKDFTGSYKNAKINGSQVILYDGKKCRIFLRSGVEKFKGEMENNIMEIVPTFGVNKYIVMDANGMEDIRLVK